METVDRPRVRFSHFELDLETAELRGEGERLDLAPQPSRVLAFLVSRAGRLVERSELRREIWGESWREWETGLHQAIRRIRVVLGDSARAPSFIETVPRRGYRFIGEVEPVEKGQSAEVRQRRFDGFPSFRPSWTAALVLLLLTSLVVAPGAPSREANRPSQEALRLQQEARYLLSARRLSAEQFTQAVAKLYRATELEPDWAEPWSLIAETELAQPGSEHVVAARRALESALVRDPEHARSWILLARLRLWQEWDWSGARQALRRASRLSPGDPDVWQLVAALETVSGRMDEALEAARRAMRLDPVSTALRVDLGWTLYYAGRLEEALLECRRTLELEPDNAAARQCAIQALMVLDRKADAAALVVRPPVEPSQALAAYWQAKIEAVESGETCGSAAASAVARIATGDDSGALAALVAGAKEGKGWEVPFARVDPFFFHWHSDERFEGVDRALGFRN